MKLILKESVTEWRKFAVVMSVVGAIIMSVVKLRGHAEFHWGWVAVPGALLIPMALSSRVFARWFYRVGMTATYFVGRIVSCLLLTLLFFLVITPMGIVLRMVGKDFLSLRSENSESYWKDCDPPTDLDRQF